MIKFEGFYFWLNTNHKKFYPHINLKGPLFIGFLKFAFRKRLAGVIPSLLLPRLSHYMCWNPTKPFKHDLTCPVLISPILSTQILNLPPNCSPLEVQIISEFKSESVSCDLFWLLYCTKVMFLSCKEWLRLPNDGQCQRIYITGIRL